MSADMPLGLSVTEKLIGLALIILGAFFSYISLTPPAGDISLFSNIFLLVGIIIAIAGGFLLIPRGE
jgi:hypothetical protein